MCSKVLQDLAGAEEEERLLRTLSHPNVVSLEGVYERDTNLHYVVMDYLKDGDLCDQLIERQRLPEPEARRIIRQVVEGSRICIVAVFRAGQAARELFNDAQRSCGTLEYAAPELLCGQPYGLKSDVFSLGIVLYVLLFGAFPFSVESAAALQCMDHFPTVADGESLAQDVLLQMLKTNDAERISAEELLSHPWFDHVNANASNAQELERVRIEDCEALGFAELLSRGFQVVKFGYKPSTTPHSTSLTSTSWKKASLGLPGRMQCRPTKLLVSVDVPSQLREIMEIREGHSTEAFLSLKSAPPSELCLSIICPWRTLDLVVETPRQREFVVRGLRRLLPSHSL
ncbi:hypothetical protein PInf_026520 [Phytophthora infestans]|nr:hypothetical protein PInf_026520 [Phytophthora infestans]